MRRFFVPLYNLLGVTGALLFIASFFANGTTDIHFHDTYFIIATGHILLLLGCYFLLLWIVYQRLCKRRMWPAITTVHVLATLFAVVALFIFSLFSPERYADYSTFHKQNIAAGLLTLAFLLAQLLFLFNAFGALLRKKR